MQIKQLSLMLISLILLVLSSCAPAVRPGLITGSIQAESDNYVVYRPGPRETLADIAGVFYGERQKTWIIEDANGDLDPKKQNVLIIPLKERHVGGLYHNGYQGIPVLCYHQFGTGSSSTMNMPSVLFEKQMRYLKENGYRVILPEELLGFLEYRQQIPKKAVMITVDDGYHSFYDVAYPILKKYGFKATLFIYTDYIGVSRKALSWDELRQLKAEGFSVESHSMHHSDLSRARKAETHDQTQQRLRDEIQRSKQILDRELNQKTICFAFPFGRSNPDVLKRVKAAGYKMAFSVKRGNNPFFSDPLVLKRDMIMRRNMKAFVSRLKTFNPVSLR